MRVQYITQVGHDAQADVLGQVRMAEVDQAAEKEGDGNDQRQKTQCFYILLREDIVEHMLNDKRQHVIGGAECQHAQDGREETGKQVRTKKGKETTIDVHRNVECRAKGKARPKRNAE